VTVHDDGLVIVETGDDDKDAEEISLILSR
jgi:hypothetical protein